MKSDVMAARLRAEADQPSQHGQRSARRCRYATWAMRLPCLRRTPLGISSSGRSDRRPGHPSAWPMSTRPKDGAVERCIHGIGQLRITQRVARHEHHLIGQARFGEKNVRRHRPYIVRCRHGDFGVPTIGHERYHNEVPPRVDYELPGLGRGLLANMIPLWIWVVGSRWRFSPRSPSL